MIAGFVAVEHSANEMGDAVLFRGFDCFLSQEVIVELVFLVGGGEGG